MKETKKHTKHAALTKPIGGEFHRNEWAIIGAPCDVIDTLADDLNTLISPHLRVAYVDADHNSGRRRDGFDMLYKDKISYQQISLSEAPKQKQYRKFFLDQDLVLVNGNHFVGDKQIVLINEKKKESLSRKLDRLNDVRIILLEHSNQEIYDFLLPLINEENVRVFRVSETAKIAKALLEEWTSNIPPLYGLILSGGKSQRMGQDKGALKYYGKEQREYEADLIKRYVHRNFISCRKSQDELIETRYDKLYDSFDGLGPFGGILSAFRAHPNAAWLSLACDLPYLDESVIKQLIKGRNPKKHATCFYNPETDFPEPLITIWEPSAYPILLEFLSQGYSCPRKVLINSDIELLHMEDNIKMKNANSPDEMQEAISYLES